MLSSRSFLIIHSKYSHVYVSIPNSLTIYPFWGFFALWYSNAWGDILHQFSSVAQSCPTLCNPINLHNAS